MILRRLSFILPTILLTFASAALAFTQMAADGFTPLDALVFVLLTLSSAYVTAQSWQVVLGLIVTLVRRRSPPPADPGASPLDPRRLAVVMPICDEDVAAVFGAIAAIRRSMGAAKLTAASIFVLSDSRDPRTARAERTAFDAAATASAAGHALPALHYRHRALNVRRKAGNIAEFCHAHGEAFDFMMVLDADSLMSGGAIRTMAEIMAADPRLGLVQSVCYPARRTTLFARVQQFAARLYAPLHTAGMAFWSGADGVYWGHNALIRVAPFIAHCELPTLPGRPPLGGEILCHDVVEAAFLRRAGWDVRLLTDLEGTWEDMPSNTLDFAVRDRRWCQGNMQHGRLMRSAGLTWAFRYHFLNGIFAYVSAPIWLGFLFFGTLQFSLGRSEGGDTLLAPALAAPVLFWLSLGIVFLPKILSLGLVLGSASARRRFGGALRLCASVLAETVFGILWSPMTQLFYSRFVAATLAGSTVAWDPQSRGDRGVGWGEAVLRHRWHTVVGLAWGLLVWNLDHTVFWWMSPLFAGLVLAIPITVLSSRPSLGLVAARLGLFLTPDEVAPAPELRAVPGDILAVAAELKAAAEPGAAAGVQDTRAQHPEAHGTAAGEWASPQVA